MTAVVWGYWAGNLGDDLFLYTLCKRFQNVYFIIICKEPFNKAFEKIENLVVQDQINFNSKVDLQIFLGGSLFMQPINEDINTKFLKTTHSGDFTAPYIVLGANFGPYSSETHYNLYKNWFRKALDVSFRDLWSNELFKSLPNVRWAPDILLGHNPIIHNSAVPQSDVISISMIKNNGRIGLPIYNEESYIEFILKAIYFYIGKGYKIQLLSFCPHQGDTIIAKEVISRMDDKSSKEVCIIEYNGDISRFIEQGYNCEYLIGTRFHSMILAWNLHIKVLPIIYNDKMLHAIYDYKFPYEFLHITKLENIAFDLLEFNRKNKPWDCKELMNQATNHFNYLQNILGENNE